MPDNNTIALGSRIKEIRMKQGLTQEKVADASGLHVTYVASVESGRRNPSYLSLRALALGLDVSVSEMLEGL